VVTPIFLGVLRRRPHRLAWIINGIFALVFAIQLVETAVLGGLLESGLVVLSGLCLVLGALVAMGLKTTIRRPAAQHPP
jgi:uncharacterized membrane protein